MHCNFFFLLNLLRKPRRILFSPSFSVGKRERTPISKDLENSLPNFDPQQTKSLAPFVFPGPHSSSSPPLLLYLSTPPSALLTITCLVTFPNPLRVLSAECWVWVKKLCDTEQWVTSLFPMATGKSIHPPLGTGRAAGMKKRLKRTCVGALPSIGFYPISISLLFNGTQTKENVFHLLTSMLHAWTISCFCSLLKGCISSWHS